MTDIKFVPTNSYSICPECGKAMPLDPLVKSMKDYCPRCKTYYQRVRHKDGTVTLRRYNPFRDPTINEIKNQLRFAEEQHAKRMKRSD